jgi:lysophospholipid acyltransferase (LPLAT)-like uncharacterized protein
MLKNLRDKPWFRTGVGTVMANYLRLVWKTNRFVLDPPDLYDQVRADLPVIVTMWHGQHFMAPFIKRAEHRVKALISHHRDADINAIAAEQLGTRTIRGSGDHERRFDRKGGVVAFIKMREALSEGWNVMLTADVPKVSRVAGMGIVKLARASGRPVYAVGIATSRRKVLKNWDKSVINLPFGRGALVMGERILVPADADDAAMEMYREQIERVINDVTMRAQAIADGEAVVREALSSA